MRFPNKTKNTPSKRYEMYRRYLSAFFAEIEVHTSVSLQSKPFMDENIFSIIRYSARLYTYLHFMQCTENFYAVRRMSDYS